MDTKNSLDYSSISLTISELNKVGNAKLIGKLNDILLHNELPKPDMHNKKDDRTTSYYEVRLDKEELENLVDLFLDLEVGSVTESGEATGVTSRYSDMVARWASIEPKE